MQMLTWLWHLNSTTNAFASWETDRLLKIGMSYAISIIISVKIVILLKIITSQNTWNLISEFPNNNYQSVICCDHKKIGFAIFISNFIILLILVLKLKNAFHLVRADLCGRCAVFILWSKLRIFKRENENYNNN